MNAPLRGRANLPCRAFRRAGFTLVELLLTMVIMSMLMVGLASAILIAGHALPEQNTSADSVLRATELVDLIASELNCAITFTERTATSIELKVPDRDADLGQETIRYAWSGTPGDPLTRQYNGGPVVTVAGDAQEFDLDYVTRTITTTESVTTTTSSGEILLASFEGWVAKIEIPQIFGVDSSRWIANFFLASSVPADANKVRITRVMLRMRQGVLGNTGEISVGIHRALGGGSPEPAAAPLGTPVVRSGADLGVLFLWEEFTFSDVVINSNNKEYVIVVKGSGAPGSAGDAEIMRYYAFSAPANDTMALWTVDAGSKWDPKSNLRDDYDFPCYVYGEYETTSTQPTDVTRYYLTSVAVKLRLGPDPLTRAETSAQVLNVPEVSGP